MRRSLVALVVSAGLVSTGAAHTVHAAWTSTSTASFSVTTARKALLAPTGLSCEWKTGDLQLSWLDRGPTPLGYRIYRLDTRTVLQETTQRRASFTPAQLTASGPSTPQTDIEVRAFSADDESVDNPVARVTLPPAAGCDVVQGGAR